MKKLLAMVLAAVMVLSLCSCATAEETVALRVWVGDNADLPWINGVIENFKAAHPEKTYDISVDIQAEGDCSKRVLNDRGCCGRVHLRGRPVQLPDERRGASAGHG